MAKLHKKQSKRVSTRTRTKIDRKVREHNRKKKKEAKKNVFSKKKRKEVSVPNNVPFKDKILKEAEDHKRKLEEERALQKERRKKERERAMNKNRNLEHLVKDAQRRTADFDKKNEFVQQHTKDYSTGKAVEISLKQYYREFKKVVEAADVVIQVLDARDPLGSRCPQVEESVMTSGPNKRLVLLLNKVDLVPRENVEQWLKYLRNEYPTVAFKASTQSQSDHLSRSKVPLTLASDDLRKSSRCLGADLLLTLLGNYCRNKDIKTSITVGIVGFPNTGKSSVINSLKRCKACSVGATPGVTKAMQQVQLDKHISLLDSPGIVMATGLSDSSTILKNCVKVESVEDPVPAADAILRRCSKEKMMMQYGITSFSDTNEFLALLAKRFGKLRKGGLPDVNKAAKSVIQDWNQGRITYYTHPPETHSLSTHLNAQIVSEMSKEFDIDSLLTEEESTLKELKQKSTCDVIMESEGPTQAQIEEVDDVEMSNDGNNEENMNVEKEEFTVPETNLVAKSSQKVLKPKTKANMESTHKGNQQLNRDKKNDLKKLKKKKKKADAVAGELADVFGTAMSNLASDDDVDEEDYNFSTDFK